MGRIRTIKPDFFADDELAQLPALSRLAFVGLWTQADREGRLEDRPARLKVQVLPYDDVDFDAVLAELEATGFIQRYSSVGKKFIQIRSFARHQRPHHTEAASSIPEPPPLAHREETVSTPSDSARKGRERKGREGKGGERERGKTPHRIPEDFALTPERGEYARKQGVLDVKAEFAKFGLHHQAKGTKHENWHAAWQFWCRRVRDFKANHHRVEAPPPTQARAAPEVQQLAVALGQRLALPNGAGDEEARRLVLRRQLREVAS